DLVYRDGQVQTGDPIYLSMVNNLFVTFNFELDGLGRYKGGGTISMNALLKGTSGWTHPLTLTAPTAFDGNTGRTTAVLDLGQLRSLVGQIDALTKIPDSSYTITLQPSVTLDGTLAGVKLNDSFSSGLDLSATNTVIKPPQQASTPGGPPTSSASS